MNSNITLGSILVVLFLFVIGQQIIWQINGRNRPARLYRDPPRSIYFRCVSWLTGTFALLLHGRVPLAGFVVGELIMFSGLGLGLWSQLTLGRNWIPGTGVHSRHKLIQDGPYRYVRHPLYTGIGLVGIGAVVATLNPLVAVAMFFHWLSIAIRTPAEEHLMAKQFGKSWIAYEARTGYFLPKIK